MKRLLLLMQTLGASKWLKVVLIAIAAIVIALLMRNALVGIAGVVGAVVQGIFGGEPTNTPRRTGSGHVPNPPRTPTNPESPTHPVPGSPSGGPRRRRR